MHELLPGSRDVHMASLPLPRNRLLSALSARDRRLLLPHLTLVPLALRQSLEKPNTRIGSVYFIEEGFASIVGGGAGHHQPRTEVGLIGPEGLTGISVVLGDDRSPHETFIQAAGRGHRMPAAELRKAMAASVSLRAFLLKFVQTLIIQTAQTAFANRRADIVERLARWVLMADDRLGRGSLPLTHELLAIMLGVRRAGVTEAVNVLVSEGLIQASPGQIRVRNRKGLERRANGTYGVPEAEYRRLIG